MSKYIISSDWHLRSTVPSCVEATQPEWVETQRNALYKLIDIAKEHNKTSIRLTVNKYNNTTIKAYEKWGFSTINDVVTDIGNDFVMDDYIMEYDIKTKKVN
jgi:hypothetical protein